MVKTLVIHPGKCTGCRNCELACSMEHEEIFRPRAARIRVRTWEREGFSTPIMCPQCIEAPCIGACESNALTRNPVTGSVDLDEELCINCKRCVPACPFGSIIWDSGSNKILKCDNCGGDPACVRFCPTQAIEWVDDPLATSTDEPAVVAELGDAVEE